MLQQALIVVITFSIGASLGFVVSALMQDVRAADERLKSQPIPLGRGWLVQFDSEHGEC